MKTFLGKGGEAALKNAYSLGRQALEQRVGVLDITAAHQQVLLTMLGRPDTRIKDCQKIIKRAGKFLAESLSPFEMAQRGFRESIDALNTLNASLEDKVEKRTQALRESEALYRSLIEISPDAITMTDIEGKIVLGNQQSARMHGYKNPDELMSINAGDYVAPEDMQRMRETALKVMKDGIIGEMEYTLIRKDGTRAPVEVRVTLLRDAAGKPRGFIGVNRDISERKHAQHKLESLLKAEAQARQKAEQDNELRLKALAIVSHELRTPLTSIKGFATTLLADDVVWDEDKQRDFILTINEEADKLSDLIEQLLELSKMDAGVFKITPTRQQPSEVITAALMHLQTLAAEHQLIINIPDTLPEVLADTQRVGQVLENLVENATKYAPKGTAIKVSAQALDDEVKISISDQGPGIPSGEREKIFQAFYRTEGTTTLKAKGAGLGLTICQRIVEAQGGHIWVDGKMRSGTTISFTLPLARVKEKQVE